MSCTYHYRLLLSVVSFRPTPAHRSSICRASAGLAGRQLPRRSPISIVGIARDPGTVPGLSAQRRRRVWPSSPPWPGRRTVRPDEGFWIVHFGSWIADARPIPRFEVHNGHRIQVGRPKLLLLVLDVLEGLMAARQTGMMAGSWRRPTPNCRPSSECWRSATWPGRSRP